MLGDAEEWFYRGLGGIDVNLSRQGASRITLGPAVLSPVKWVRTHYASALGQIESDWQRGASQTDYEFAVPANSTATITLNTPAPRAVTINGVRLSRAPGVISNQIGEDSLSVVVGSGRYQIRAANPQKE